MRYTQHTPAPVKVIRSFYSYLLGLLANANDNPDYAYMGYCMFVDIDGTFFDRVGNIRAFGIELPNHARTGDGDEDYVCLFTNDELGIFRQLCGLINVKFITRRDNPDTRSTLTRFGIPETVEICVVPREQTKADYIQTYFGEQTSGAMIIIMDDLEKEINDYLRHERLGRRAEIIQPSYL
jgi:hypothetical protein